MGMLDGIIDPEELRHRAPEAGRTLYLPVSGDGGIDGHGGDATSVDALDKKVDEVNAATLDYASEHLCSFCDEPGCGQGCGDVPRSVPDFAADDAIAPVKSVFQGFVDVIAGVGGMTKNYAGEQLVDRLSSVYSGGGSTFDLNEIGGQAQTVLASMVEALAASKKSGDEALAINRLMVQALRNSLADRAEHRVNALTMMWMAPMSLNPVGLAFSGVSAAMTAYDMWQGNSAEQASLEQVKAAQPKLEEAAKTNDEAVSKLLAALDEWKVTPNMNAVPSPPKPADSDHGEGDVEGDAPPPLDSTPLPAAAPVTGGDAAPSSDPLEDLFNEPDAELPPSMMPDAGMPSSGMGSPLGGGSPMDSGMGSPLGGAGSDPFGSEPLSDALEDTEEPEDEEPLDDLTDEDEDKKDDELFPEDDSDVDGDTPDTDIDADVDTDTDKPDETPEESPENGDVAPVAADPAAATPGDDTAARTVDVGGGRQVTFPTTALADAARSMVEAAEAGNPKSLYLAASENGFSLPPMGQDVGQQVPPALLQAGDVVVNKDGMGIFIGNGDVLWESGEIKPLADVATFDGQNQGLFRLEESAPAADGLNGPAQPVASDGSAAPVASGEPVTATPGSAAPVPPEPAVSTPGQVTDQAGTPGVPTDTKADDLSATSDTEAGAGFGTTDNGAAGLDPAAAFPS